MSGRTRSIRVWCLVTGALLLAPACSGGGAGAAGSMGTTCGALGGFGGANLPQRSDPWAKWPMPNGPADVASGAPNPASYTDNGDGTVTDNVTGLMWQQTVTETMCSSDAALAYCPTVTVAGHHDWRLPSAIELMSIVDYSVIFPAIDGTAFPAASTRNFWSSTPIGGGPAGAISIGFDAGSSVSALSFNKSAARCVRLTPASAPAVRYTIADGTVYDTQTKLTWQQAVTPTTYTLANAKIYCTGLGATLGGTGWRVPTVKELLTIVDFAAVTARVDTTAFPDTPREYFWSSTPLVNSSTVTWTVHFATGSVDTEDVALHYVRCVR